MLLNNIDYLCIGYFKEQTQVVSYRLYGYTFSQTKTPSQTDFAHFRVLLPYAISERLPFYSGRCYPSQSLKVLPFKEYKRAIDRRCSHYSISERIPHSQPVHLYRNLATGFILVCLFLCMGFFIPHAIN